jgi:hypothetical protein
MIIFYRLFKMTDIKIDSIFSVGYQKYYFWYRFFKMADTRNKNSFLVSFETIDRHYKKI